MLISAKIIRKPRARRRVCEECGRGILPGEQTLRLYGAASSCDPPYVLYCHIACAEVQQWTHEKIRHALDTAD
jgi:hypothetical protein